jgi:NAD(P)H-dependent FMN reductase
VLEYREQLRESDGVVIASPEYAHGVPGALKNALDWVVGSGELVYKPVSLINASPQSKFAFASLTETLTVMDARLVPGACLTVPLAGKKLDEAGIAAHPEIGPALRDALAALAQAIAAVTVSWRLSSIFPMKRKCSCSGAHCRWACRWRP